MHEPYSKHGDSNDGVKYLFLDTGKIEVSGDNDRISVTTATAQFIKITCSVFLMLAGVVFIVYGSFTYRTEGFQNENDYCVGMAVDDSGKGKQASIYSYSRTPIILQTSKSCHGEDVVKQTEKLFPSLKKYLTIWQVSEKAILSAHATSQTSIDTSAIQLERYRDKVFYTYIWRLIKECFNFPVLKNCRTEIENDGAQQQMAEYPYIEDLNTYTTKPGLIFMIAMGPLCLVIGLYNGVKAFRNLRIRYTPSRI